MDNNFSVCLNNEVEMPQLSCQGEKLIGFTLNLQEDLVCAQTILSLHCS